MNIKSALYRDIGKTQKPQLEREEELLYIQEYQKSGCEKSLKKLWESHLKSIFQEVEKANKQNDNDNITFSDLYSEATEITLKCLQDFKSEFKVRFNTYLKQSLYRSLVRYKEEGWQSVRKSKGAHMVKDISKEMYEEEAIEDSTDRSEACIKRILEVLIEHKSISKIEVLLFISKIYMYQNREFLTAMQTIYEDREVDKNKRWGVIKKILVRKVARWAKEGI